MYMMDISNLTDIRQLFKRSSNVFSETTDPRPTNVLESLDVLISQITNIIIHPYLWIRR